jgi:hypothetical protein
MSGGPTSLKLAADSKHMLASHEGERLADVLLLLMGLELPLLE